MFLHPWILLLGALAIGLPVLIHKLTQPKPIRVPSSTIRFIQSAVQQRRKQHRLRDLIVLTLRTLAVALLTFALARPLIGLQRQEEPVEQARVVRVVVMDLSQSMATRNRNVELFERGRPLAAKMLGYQDDLKADLILAGARSRAVFGTPSTNLPALQQELAAAKPRPEKLNVQLALNLASDLLLQGGGEADDVRRELVFVSDFQRANWATADFSVLPEDTEIQLLSVAGEETPPNLAVLNVSTQGRAEVGQELLLTVDVGNYSSTPRQVQVDVSLGDAVYQIKGLCTPGSQTKLSDKIIPREAGWLTGEAKLVGNKDALPVDDRRPCALEIRKPPAYVLITRQPASQRPSSSYYLERGLLPVEPRDNQNSSRLVRLDPDNFDTQVLADADVIVLDHPGRLSQDVIRHLAALLRRGRGILYVSAEPIDATNLRLLSEAIGDGGELPVEFFPPALTERRQDLLLSEPSQDRAPFSIFGDNLKAAIAPLRFSGGLSSRRKENALADDILASLSDRSALLVVSSHDAGVLAVLNADLGSSNLHQSPIYVPLLAELVQNYILHRGQGNEERICGEAFVVDLPAETGSLQGLKISGPSPETENLGSLSQEAYGLVWSAEAMDEPGVYRIQRNQDTEYALVVARPPEESDLRSLTSNVLQTRLAGERRIQFNAIDHPEATETDLIWTWLAIACMFCLIGEIVALKLFRT
ncbi:MAG: BatA and WFA domain-containing protein [Planctomycetaceae bacterium]|nr:BatA and WFA domain-containing protein [Planctomycetaceae bacterium]